MITEQHLEKILKAEASQKIVFKRQLTDSTDARDILNSFEEMLKNKPYGYWLMRESRQVGMISISFKSRGQIKHFRFAFIKGEWTTISEIMLNSGILKELEPDNLNQYNIADKCEQLIQRIGVDINKIVLPNQHQQSDCDAYSNYIVVAESNDRYADPIESLLKINDLINDALINESSLITLKNDALIRLVTPLSEEALREAFSNWLLLNDLDHDLLCPISYELFAVPYVLSSGRTFEKSSLFDERGIKYTHCPITKKMITTHPYQLEGYTPSLKSCLTEFVKLIDLCKKKSLSNMEQEKKACSIINPCIVPTSLFYNDPNQAEVTEMISNTSSSGIVITDRTTTPTPL